MHHLAFVGKRKVVMVSPRVSRWRRAYLTKNAIFVKLFNFDRSFQVAAQSWRSLQKNKYCHQI